VRTFDAATTGAAGMILVAVFAAAAAFPAMRATKINPVEILRAE
jgi:ABC-type antimicrobial peptide transport system permease subunit